jgi:enoyl-CoA hydratase/carnithine racemase
MGDLVVTEKTDGVAVVSYNRPEKHNAMNNEMGAQVREAMHWALHDPNTRVVVLRGEGKSFSSGRDITQLGGRPGGESHYDWVRESQEVRFEMMASKKIFIAAMKGYSLGGAFEVCLTCDIRIAADDTQMSLPEITYGILPDTGGTQLLTAIVGPGIAKELVLTGRRFTAAEALSWGVVNRVVPAAELDDTVMTLARQIAANAPLALALGKQLIDSVWADQVHRGLRSEVLAQAVLFGSEDYVEARAARREGRPAKFIGK